MESSTDFSINSSDGYCADCSSDSHDTDNEQDVNDTKREIKKKRPQMAHVL